MSNKAIIKDGWIKLNDTVFSVNFECMLLRDDVVGKTWILKRECDKWFIGKKGQGFMRILGGLNDELNKKYAAWQDSIMEDVVLGGCCDR